MSWAIIFEKYGRILNRFTLILLFKAACVLPYKHKTWDLGNKYDCDPVFVGSSPILGSYGPSAINVKKLSKILAYVTGTEESTDPSDGELA